jgi:hypothetical protein
MKEIVSQSDNDSAAVKTRCDAAPLLIDGVSVIMYLLACVLPTINDIPGYFAPAFG